MHVVSGMMFCRGHAPRGDAAETGIEKERKRDECAEKGGHGKREERKKKFSHPPLAPFSVADIWRSVPPGRRNC